MELKDLKEITILPEDIDDINAWFIDPVWKNHHKGKRDTSGQFIVPDSCPIARALKRIGFKKVNVNPTDVRGDGDVISIKGNFEDVHDAVMTIKAGASSAVIEIL